MRRYRIKDSDKWLPGRFYREHLRHFPLVTVDLVVTGPSPRFLLVRRSGKNLNWKGVWATPGGRLFRNEGLLEAASRILLREAGIVLPPASFRFRGVEEIVTVKEHGVTLVFSASTSRRELLADDSSSSVRWFRPDECPASLKQEYRAILTKGGVRLGRAEPRAREGAGGRAPSSRPRLRPVPRG